ncbi:MAG: hypothetical protein H6622_13150 [Halobacteriovoraceae bacterium]|nr:hypothetical protein [Halobacteriovoraceae bacterium]
MKFAIIAFFLSFNLLAGSRLSELYEKLNDKDFVSKITEIPHHLRTVSVIHFKDEKIPFELKKVLVRLSELGFEINGTLIEKNQLNGYKKGIELQLEDQTQKYRIYDKFPNEKLEISKKMLNLLPGKTFFTHLPKVFSQEWERLKFWKWDVNRKTFLVEAWIMGTVLNSIAIKGIQNSVEINYVAPYLAIWAWAWGFIGSLDRVKRFTGKYKQIQKIEENPPGEQLIISSDTKWSILSTSLIESAITAVVVVSLFDLSVMNFAIIGNGFLSSVKTGIAKSGFNKKFADLAHKSTVQLDKASSMAQEHLPILIQKNIDLIFSEVDTNKKKKILEAREKAYDFVVGEKITMKQKEYAKKYIDLKVSSLELMRKGIFTMRISSNYILASLKMLHLMTPIALLYLDSMAAHSFTIAGWVGLGMVSIWGLLESYNFTWFRKMKTYYHTRFYKTCSEKFIK